jgi:hypothetical protein
MPLAASATIIVPVNGNSRPSVLTSRPPQVEMVVVALTVLGIVMSNLLVNYCLSVRATNASTEALVTNNLAGEMTIPCCDQLMVQP